MMYDYILVDSPSVLYALFYSMPKLSNRDGIETGVIKGFDNFLNKINNKFVASKPIFFFESAKNFRKDISSDYKIHRKSMPDGLKQQMPYVKELLSLKGLPALSLDGYESDDLIGAVAVRLSDDGKNVVIITNDKDMNQLVSDKIHIFNHGKDEIIRQENVLEKYEILPSQFVDYLTMVGDASDNVKGLSGVGSATAKRLLKKYGSIENILENKSQLTGRVKSAFEDQEAITLASSLVRIDLDAPIDMGKIVSTAENVSGLSGFYKKFGIRSANASLDLFSGSEASMGTGVDGFLQAVDIDIKSISTDLSGLTAEKIFFVPHNGEIFLLANRQIYRASRQDLPSGAMLIGFGVREFASTHSVKDLSLISHLLYNVSEPKFPFIFSKFFDVSFEELSDIEEPIRQLVALPRLHDGLVAECGDYAGFDKLLSLEEEVRGVLLGIEEAGMRVDADYLTRLGQEFGQKIESLRIQIFAIVGEEFNLNSPKQLQDILFNRLGIESSKKTKGGQLSTSEDVLARLAKDYDVVELLLQYRKFFKLQTTYVEGLKKSMRDDGRIHTTLSQITAITGRLASAEPNLQNIPTRSTEGKKIQNAFIPRDGYEMCSVDYSQIELRVMAHLADEEAMLRAFQEGKDIHLATASEVFAIPIDEVSSEDRDRAKAVNFGIIYGISAFGLANNLNIAQAEAKDFIEKYFAKYQKIKDYLLSQMKLAYHQGYVSTIMGRKIFVSLDREPNFGYITHKERVAINAPVQGSAAEIIKLAMVNVDKALKGSSIDAKMIMQVHDELLFEVRPRDKEALKILLVKEMTNVMELKVDLKVNVSFGKSWGEL